MITKQDLQAAIAECEGQRNPSANTCLKLAAFYTIKDKMYPDKDSDPVFYSRAAEPVAIAPVSSTEFGQMVSGMDADVVMPVMDELMSTLQVIAPRLYAGVMNKLSDM